MFEGEFTHQGNLCTFEVLMAAAKLDDPALRAISQIVHDLDLNDQLYQREETAGVARFLEGICLPGVADEIRLQRGSALLDGLYEAFRRCTA